MKKEDVPQDMGPLGKITKEVCYATDKSGNYVTALSNGWDIKTNALDTAWQDVDKRVQAAKEKVARGEVSPLLYFMEKGVMDVKILAGYTGLWQWQIERHMRPGIFKKLPDKKLERYAEVFGVTMDELKNMSVHDD